MYPRIFDVLILLIAASFAGFSFFISISLSDPQWFERSGSIVALLAAIVEYRQFSRGENEKSSIPLSEMRINQTLPGTQSKSDKVISRIGLIILCLGTVIWGYGSPFFELLR